MSDGSEAFKPLGRLERLQRWLEVRIGYEFLCQTCNRMDLPEEGEGGGGCIGMCRMTDQQRAQDYLAGSDAYIPRYRNRRRLGG